MYVLGINCYSHDAAAALIKDGEIRTIIEEERLNRDKHSDRFPALAIRKCLDVEGISIEAVDHFTYYAKPWMEVTENIGYFLKYLPSSLHLLTSSAGSGMTLLQRLRVQFALGKTLQQEFGLRRTPSIHFIEHHLAHAASAFYVSPFEEAAIITWDGRGEKATTLVARGRGNQITKLREVHVPHSLGVLYSAVTDHLGFKPFVDEWKVMGMSAYGTPALAEKFRRLVRLEDRGGYSLDLAFFKFHTHGADHWLSDRFSTEFGPRREPQRDLDQRHFDLAFALQRAVEDVGVHVANYAYEITKLPALCIAGGVALNVLLNQKIVERAPFEKFFIQPVASDSGTSAGCALYHYFDTTRAERSSVLTSVYLGPSYSNDEIEATLKSRGVNYSRSENIARDVARHIFEGKITGWFQGRMEAGPRALGNRSIVVNPMDPGMKHRLNERVKLRESFRPFAPSVLEEHASAYFEMPKNQVSPYMILCGNVRPDKRALIPAVTHADNTARVHTVNRVSNPRYWDLINEFGTLSGVPVVLNTSFNENEPIVCTPDDAVGCFLRTKLDVLGIGDFLVTKSVRE